MRTLNVLAAVIAVSFLATPARAELTDCTLEFSLSGWSLVYKQMKGEGNVFRATVAASRSASPTSSEGRGLSLP